MESYIINNELELLGLAEKLAPFVLKHKIVLLYGEMGAGKTTFIKSLVKVLGGSDEVSSPTYSIVNEYIVKDTSLYHFDLFRLKSEREAYDIGIEEYLDSGKLCCLEWPQHIEHLVEHPLKIEIEKMGLNSRKFSIFKV